MSQSTQQKAEAIFVGAYDEYADAIFRFCFFKLPNQEHAEDITQEVFTRFWDALRDGKEIKNKRAFLYTIARNLIIDWYRKKKSVSLDVLQEDTGFDPLGDDGDTIITAIEAKDAFACIQKLDSTYREVLILRYVEGLPVKEIAKLHKETANAISVRINRAHKKLLEVFTEYYE